MIQKELVKQRNEADAVVDRCVQIVKLQIEQYNNAQRSTDGDLDEGKYVTRDELKLLLQSRMLAAASAEIDNGDLEGSVARLTKDSNDLDADYQRKRDELAERLRKVRSRLGDGIEIGGDFAVEFDDTEPHDLVDVGVGRDGAVDRGDPVHRPAHTTGRRRNVGLTCNVETDSHTVGSGGIELGTPVGGLIVDEHRIAGKVATIVMERVEGLMGDLIATLSGGRIDSGDARALVQQLSVLQTIKTEVEKLKLMLAVKSDRAEIERELAIRVTREEVFSLLVSVFPGNVALHKALAAFKGTLPPLRTSSRPLTPAGEHREADEVRRTPKKRAVQTATGPPQPMIPARNSRFLALNQKYLKGADGRYYLRDTAGEPPLASSGSKVLGPEQAFDFQPFLPMPCGPEEERINASPQHRQRAPESND
jgi:hypothetical protein